MANTSGAVGQVYYKVVDNNKGDYASSGPNIFNDIVSQVNATKFTKIGVQAPPGTKVVINNTKTIMIGKTGIYELDEGINITSMFFVRPIRYIKNEERSNRLKQEGIDGMIAADEKRQAAMAKLDEDYPVLPDEFLEDGQTINPDYTYYWEKYNNIQSDYIKEYTAALNKFNTGSNGVYEKPNPNNPNDPQNFEDLYNVIIDYIYEEGTGGEES